MRLGHPVYNFKNADEWIMRHKEDNLGAAYWCLGEDASDGEISAYSDAADKNGIVIAEVGAWSNIISPDEDERKRAVDYNIKRLKTADRVSARCCVNISGSKAKKWDGYVPGNYSKEIFNEIVQTVQYIIDSAEPEKTFYTIELMPWAIPDDADSYLELIEKINRKAFAVHLDPVNIITSPRKYCKNGEVIQELFDKLGDKIKSCHAKDVTMRDDFITHISEIQAGLGTLDYRTYLKCLDKLDDVPLMIEHLGTYEEYRQAADYITKTADAISLRFE